MGFLRWISVWLAPPFIPGSAAAGYALGEPKCYLITLVTGAAFVASIRWELENSRRF